MGQVNIEQITDEELLKELIARVQRKDISWQNVYYFNTSNRSLILKTEKQNFSISFNSYNNIEQDYFARQIYKSVEPTLKKFDERKERENNELNSKLMQTLKFNLMKKKKK